METTIAVALRRDIDPSESRPRPQCQAFLVSLLIDCHR